ncbi:MAG: hypothetical protein D6737_19565 [Chloroflexi bacterium]|nr:MAG: hypothetical protein D6737_19565 [Chloroflexota bacterium]
MTQWEYLTKFIRADKKKEGVREFIEQKWPEWHKPPRYTPEAMIPELNRLGDAGWELMHIEPIADVGRKGDIRFDGTGSTWSNIYFCVFKRPKGLDPTDTQDALLAVTVPENLPDDPLPAHSPHPVPLDIEIANAQATNGNHSAPPTHSPYPAPPGDVGRPH